MAKHERRFAIDGWQALDFHVRAVEEDGDGMTFEGYASVFNRDSDGPIPGWGVEQIAPTAFDKSLKDDRDIKMFLNHNSDLVLASRAAGTLELDKDDTGLLARARFIDTTVGTDTAKNVRAGNVSKMSFGFTPVRFNARKDGVDGVVHTEVRLWEVSPVTSWPAYTATSASVRHLAEATDTDPDELSEAFRLLEGEEPLSDEAFNTLLRVLNIRRGEREQVLAPMVAEWRAKLAQYEAA